MKLRESKNVLDICAAGTVQLINLSKCSVAFSATCMNENIHSVGGHDPIDIEALAVISLISRSNQSAQYFGGAHRGTMCMYMHS
jgi:hypothetical protein